MNEKQKHIIHSALLRLSTRLVYLYLLILYVNIQAIIILYFLISFSHIEHWGPYIFNLIIFTPAWIMITVYALYPAKRLLNYRWRFWVLKHIHYLQDFVIIRKIAENKGYINRYEKWLSEKDVISSSKRRNKAQLLEKLEIFEYAFQKEFEHKIPKQLRYKVSKQKGRFLLFQFYICSIAAIVFVHLIMIEIFYVTYLIALIFGIFWEKVPRLKAFLLGKPFIEVNQDGIKSFEYREKFLIPWKYVKRLEYVERKKSTRSSLVTPFLLLYIDYNNYPKKVIQINISQLNATPKVVFQEMNRVHRKYLEELQTTKNG